LSRIKVQQRVSAVFIAIFSQWVRDRLLHSTHSDSEIHQTHT
jgi:hypothetical protein